MSPEELEANYIALVESGAYTWESLAATARNNGWAAIEAIAAKHAKTSKPVVETAAKTAPETADIKPRKARTTD